MTRFILLVLLWLISGVAMAQTQVTGTVKSAADDMSIPGVTVMIKGTSTGVSTDIDGRYVIETVPSNAILVFSSIGFTTLEIPVNGRAVLNAQMKYDSHSLDEVILVAYGTAKKGAFTGSATAVSADAIRDIPGTSFESALNGKVAGMQVSTLSGQAGSTSSIRIRGVGSMNASNEPLYVIDGVPVVSGSSGQMGDYIYTSNNVMSTINPNDIENITILKDAAASALYGSRAANGVVMIQTKRGKQGKPVVSFKASVGFTPDWATDNFEVAGPEEQVEMYYEMFWNAGKLDGDTDQESSTTALAQLNKRFNKHGYAFSAPDHTASSLVISDYDNSGRAGSYYDWENYLFRTAAFQTYDLSVSGASDQTSYYSSISYTDQEGRSITNDYDRFTARLNVTQKVGKIIEFTTNINIARSTKQGFNDTRSTGDNYFMQSRNLLWPMYWPTDYKTGDDWTARYGSYAQNAVYYNNEWDNNSRTLRISASETVKINITDYLDLRSVFSYDNSQTMDHIYFSPDHYKGSSDKGVVHELATNNNKWVSSTLLNFNKEIADKHTISALVGFEAENNRTDFQRSSGSNLPTSSLPTVSTAGKLDASGYWWGNSMVSVLSKVDYNYANKYYVSGSYRRDGSSKLGPESRWGDFWSISGSWKIDNEKFMENIDVISNLRIRASYGVNGTLPSSSYGWRSLTSYSAKYMLEPGGGVSTISDPNLSWETNYTTNIAIDFGLFDQRFYGTIEYFNRDSKDLLQLVPISTATGFGSTLRNIGEINNKGIEIEIGADIIRTRNFNWDLSVTASSIKSTVTKLYGGKDIIWNDPTGGDSRAKYIYKEGESTLSLYGREWAGVDAETGKNIWFMNPEAGETVTGDLTKDGRPVTYDYKKANETIIGNIHPKLYGGINTNLSWKGISLGLNFIYKLGGYTYDAVSKDTNDDGYYWERIMSQDAYDNRWTPTNKNSEYPQRVAIDMEDVNQKSSRHMHKADYLRLKNLSLSYNLPRNLISKIKMSSARVYFNATNLFTIAAYDVYDPEVNEYGTRGWEIPQGKTYTFGVEFSF